MSILRLTIAGTICAIVALAAAATVSAGDRCAAHFSELRAFVDAAGSRATPDEDTAAALADELAIERALWNDEAGRHRQRLEAVGAGVGVARLETINAELSAAFDELASLLGDQSPLDDGLVDQLLDCGADADAASDWQIRSLQDSVHEDFPEHREVVVADRPPDGYFDPPGSDLRASTKAAPETVWPDDPIDPIVAKAAELGHDPIAIYRFVLNEIRADHSFGPLKIPAVVLQSGSGNDADQAMLLAELLRASGFPARLAMGVVELPTDRLLAHFGVFDASTLESTLTTIGAAWSPVGGGTQPSTYRIERFWCEVWLPYGNFRGIALDGSGETWAVLDPELESRFPENQRRIFDEMSFDSELFFERYLAGDFCAPDLTQPGACPEPRRLVESAVDQYLSGISDPETYQTLAAPAAALADDLPILPASMPGHVVSVAWVGIEPPLDDRPRMRLVARDGGRVLLDAVIPLTELTGREAAIWYAPATHDDELIVRAFDNFLWNVPPYLINVTPQVIHRGGEIARGAAGTGMGRAIDLGVTVTTPAGASAAFSNGEITGVPTAIGIAAGPAGYEVVGDAPASSLEMLSLLVDRHLDDDHRFAAELAVLGGHGMGYGLPSIAFMGNEVEIDGFLGLVESIDWLGLHLDVDVRGSRAAGGSPDSLRAWRTLAQLGGSVAERAIFETFGVTSVSADLALVVADALGGQVLTVDQGNLAAVLATLPYPSPILAEIEAWVLAGGEALVPAQPVSFLQWTGVGYVLVDPASGAARYQLAGGLSGSSTADPPDEAQQEFGLDLWPPTRYPVNTDPTAVVAVNKLAGFDGAEGVVGSDAEIGIRVEAVDGHGARVQGVPVHFVSVAGGGTLIDGGGGAAADVWIATDEHGTAAVAFRFGTDTSSNPVYALQNPGDEHATQALLHLVDAVGQGVDGAGDSTELPVSEPFWALVFPDAPVSLRRTDTAETHFIGLVAQWSDTIYLAVEDQYGNPVSNVPVTFGVQPLQLDAACSNELPPDQHVNAAVFDNLSIDGEPPCGGHPALGNCGGPTLAKGSSYAGVSAGVIEGNVFAATYTVDVGAAGLAPLSYTYTQNWTIDGTTGGCDTPDRFRVFSNFLTDEEGRNVNATAVGDDFDWPIDFWIEYYEPEPRPGNPPPDPPFYAGGGDWRPTCGNDLALSVSNGGSSAAPVLDPSSWSYRTFVTAGGQPGVNEVRALGGSFTFCDSGEPLTRPLDESFNKVWGVLAAVTGFDPTLVALTADDLLAEPLEIKYRLQPQEYLARSVDVEVVDQTDEVSTMWPGTNRSDEGSATLPRGQLIEIDHEHLAKVVVNRSHPAEVLSEDVALPLHQPIFTDVTTLLRVSQELDVVNRTSCADNDVFSFTMNHSAAVTLSFVRNTPTGPGSPEIFINNVVLGEGEHSFTFSPSSATAADFTLLPGSYDFELVGISQITGEPEAVEGKAVSFFAMRDTLPVGHAMVKGVDLLDGHLVVSREDLSIPGRGIPLSFERTYSSASASPGHLGRGWTHNWLARVVETPCAELLLIGTEGSGMRFTPDGAGGWKPPLGYHGTLIVDDTTNDIDFYTTGGIRYHFLPVTTLAGDPLGEWMLDHVEDPSGNRTILVYEEGGDGLPRVKRVIEPAGRELVFTYDHRIFQHWGGDVLTRVDGPDILEVGFAYDARGNLVEARRENGARVESYDYDLIAFRDLLTGVTNNLNGATTTYAYSNEVLGLVGEAADIFLVERLTEPEGGTTRFFYDTSAIAANDAVLTTWVRSPRTGNPTPPAPGSPDPFDTTYTLNRYGSPTAITDPLGNTTTMVWPPDDVVLISRTDAKGVTTNFDYDDHGNLLSETVTVTDIDEVEHTYVSSNTYHPPTGFDPPFIKNRIATHTDRRDAETVFSYDGTGRLLSSEIWATAADGTSELIRTSHTYDPSNGDRLTTTDPRGNTTTFAYDGRGDLLSSSIEVTDHAGSVSTVTTSTAWDILGRPVALTDPQGFVTDFAYDTLGRLIATTYPEVEVDTDVYWRPVEESIYDDAANTVTTVDGNGHATISTFDLQGRLVQVDNPVGGTKTIGYDPAGNTTSESRFFDAGTPRIDTWFGYDNADRLVLRNEPEARRTDYEYDAVGNLTVETLSGGNSPGFVPRVTENDYDELNRVIRTTRDPSGLAATTELLLDGVGNVVRTTDAEGRITHHRFDELQRRIETIEPAWRPGYPKTTRFFHDGNGNLEQEIRFNQRLEDDGSWIDHDQVRRTRYDELNRPIVATDAEGGLWTTVYDRSGNVVEEIDARGHSTSHVYDGLNRRIRSTVHLSDPGTGAPWEVVTSRVYDAVGNLRHELWPNGNHVTHTYDAADRLNASSDLVGPIVSYGYDARGNRKTETDGNGHSTLIFFDGMDRIWKTSIPGIRDNRFSWDAAGNRVVATDALDHRTDDHYDALDRLVLVEFPEQDGVRYTSSSTYDLVGNTITSTGRNGHTTTFIYDDLNRVVETLDPLLAGPPAAQYSVVSTYDAVGNRVAEIDRRGIASRWEFDRENRTTGAFRDGFRIASTEYDAAGNPEYVTDANGNTTHTIFDERDLELRIDRPEGSTTWMFRDAMGDVAREFDGESKETTRVFDLRRLLTGETNGNGETTEFGYDFVGNQTTVERPRGPDWTWKKSYDRANRLVAVIDPLGNRTRYQYDGQDNLRVTTDAKYRSTNMEYDSLDRLIESRYPDGTFHTFTYDGNGNRLTATDPKGQTMTSGYDELDREVLRSFSAPVDPVADPVQTIEFSWDPNSNLVDAVETYTSGTRVTHHEWDGFDRLDRVTDGFGKVLDYGYDLNGNRTSLTDPDGAVTGYTYDGLNRLDTVTLPDGAGIADYDWYRNGLLERVTYPNGTVASYGYDDANRVDTIDNLGPGGAPISTYAYGYDANGNRSQQVELNGGPLETTTYEYDLDDRLWQVAYPDRTTVYSFDSVGNRVAERSEGPTGSTLVDRGYTYDDRYRLLAVDDLLDPTRSIAYAYDLNGNQTSRSQGVAVLDFRYDSRDRLLEVDVDSSPAWTFDFDYRGLRVGKWGAEGLLHYTYDETSVLQQYSAIGDPVATYRYGADRLLAVDHFSQGLAYYHFDALGSIADLTDPSGAVQNRYQYDAWGNYRFQSGVQWNPFGFTGYEYDQETDLYYAKARFYDPEVGRFLTEDPAEPDLTTPPSLHRYLYAYGNPTYYTDPDGREGMGLTEQDTETIKAMRELLPEEANEQIDNSIEAGAGAVTGAVETVVGVPFLFFYNGVGSLGYKATGKEMFRQQAEDFEILGEPMREAFYGGPEAALEIAVQGFMIAVQEYNDALERGDSFAAGRAFGRIGMSIALIRQTVRAPARTSGPTPAPAFATTSGATVPSGTGVLTAVGPEIDLAAAGITLMNTSDEQSSSSRKSETSDEGSPSSEGQTTVTPWGTRDVASGKFTTGPRGGIDPVDIFIEEARANGFEVLGKEITFKTPFEPRKVDLVIRNPRTGRIGAVEIKSTPSEFSKLKTEQFAADRYINRFGADAAGENAVQAGVSEIDYTIKILWEAQ